MILFVCLGSIQKKITLRHKSHVQQPLALGWFVSFVLVMKCITTAETGGSVGRAVRSFMLHVQVQKKFPDVYVGSKL